MATSTTTHMATRPPPSSHERLVVWSNSAYSLDDCSSSVGSNGVLLGCSSCSHGGGGGGGSGGAGNKGREVLSVNTVSEEELRLREELAEEIEKELERELVEGILVLVRRLSDLKAKQIAKGLRDPYRPWNY